MGKWESLQWEDCQHSIVTAFSPVCGRNTLPNVCTWCNSICSGVAGQLDHLRRASSIHSRKYEVVRWCCDDDDAYYHFQTSREAWSRSMARKFWSELLLAACSPLNHSHANAKALSRCNPQLCWNQEIKRMFAEPFPAVYQSSATDPIWLNFLLLPRFFDPKNRSQPLLFCSDVRPSAMNWN